MWQTGVDCLQASRCFTNQSSLTSCKRWRASATTSCRPRPRAPLQPEPAFPGLPAYARQPPSRWLMGRFGQCAPCSVAHQAVHGVEELDRAERFDQVGIAADLLPTFHVGALPPSGQKNDFGGVLQIRILFDF